MPTITEMAERMRAHNAFGAMHVVVCDGNLDEANIRACLEQPDVTEADRVLAADLLAMSEADREAAFAEAFEPDEAETAWTEALWADDGNA